MKIGLSIHVGCRWVKIELKNTQCRMRREIKPLFEGQKLFLIE